MNCEETQRLITKFMGNELSLEQTEQFLKHIESCSECKEELEVYYILLIGMKQLDGEKKFATNLHGEFEMRLKEVEEKIRKKKYEMIPKIILFVTIIVFCIIVLTHEDKNTEKKVGENFTSEIHIEEQE